MRFKASDIGLLVRPKTITHLFLWTKDKNVDEWWKQTCFQYRWRNFEKKQQLTSFYKIPLNNLFQDLHLGNPCKNLEKSYISEITSFIILHKGSLYYIDTKEKAEYFEKEMKKRFGQNAYLSVVAVGLKFYKSIEKKEEEFLPKDPWDHTNRQDVVWFYHPKEIIPLSNIMLFESLKLSDLVKMKRIDGIVISIKELAKPKFYSANSCVSKSIMLLSTNVNYVRLIPEKRFSILR